MGEYSIGDPTDPGPSSGRRRIEDHLAAAALFAPGLGRARREMLCIAHLDAERRLIGMRLRYSAFCGQVALPLRTIVADAIALHSHGLVVAHNHPSGDPTPSDADLSATRALVRLARPLGIAIHDHLVFAGERFVSLRERGLL